MKCLFIVIPCECVGKNVIQTFKAIGIYPVDKEILPDVIVSEDHQVFEVCCPKCQKKRRLHCAIEDTDKILDLFVPYSEAFVLQEYVL